jgi:hypothetical protein
MCSYDNLVTPVDQKRIFLYNSFIMKKKTSAKIPVRNWVVKNDQNRAARHRVRTQYQRHPRHRHEELGQ